MSTTGQTGDQRIRDVPQLPVPEHWARVLDAWPSAHHPRDVVAGIEHARTAGLVADAMTGTFVTELRAALAGAAGSVMVAFGDPAWVVPVISLVGAVLGDVTYRRDGVLGGSASVVPTGGVDHYEQAWHTDSTPWDVPHKWSVLGLLAADPTLERPVTSVLPWTLVSAAWCGERTLEDQLRTHRFSWRERYKGLPALSAPVLGDVPRWFRPALAEFLDDPQRRVAACAAIDHCLQRATAWFEAEVSAERVLVFDNHAVLHRGPAVRRRSCRTLLRLKVDGTPRR